ncbi:unnamed protein product [Menidia menidia]|uniref:(Atlantic silverside) hypothetical protein n=1 Tax=Menidia menidia TaxID=238744 RepID=A0A8S4BG79_9TELE|nr:unnamed protein product [Menidia menidia]
MPGRTPGKGFIGKSLVRKSRVTSRCLHTCALLRVMNNHSPTGPQWILSGRRRWNYFQEFKVRLNDNRRLLEAESPS